MDHRVVITGIGLCSALGHDPARVVEAIRSGRCGLLPIQSFDPADLNTKFAGEVRDFDPSRYFSPQEEAALDRATQMAVGAATGAFEHAAYDFTATDGSRLAVAVGVSGASQYQNARFTLDRKQVLTTEAAFFSARSLPYFQAAFLSKRFSIHGPQIAFSAASAGSGIAIGYAADLLRSGKADLVLAGGAECLTITGVSGMDKLQMCAPGPCSPFSGAAGMSLGEGAAFLILETYDHAIKRGAVPIAEVLGYAIRGDAYDPIATDPSGDGLYRAMAATLERSGLTPAEIGWIKASGTSHREQDVAETFAVKRLFDGVPTPPVTSLEPYFGHANGASPALGIAAAALCRNANFIPATLNFLAPRPRCDLEYVPNQARAANVRYFLATSIAFGGGNAVIAAGQSDGRTVPRPRTDSIVITGMGILSTFSSSLEEFTDGLRNQRSSISKIERFATAACRSTKAGLIPPCRLQGNDGLLADVRRLDPLKQYALIAVSRALRDAGIDQGAIAGERIGVVTGLCRGPAASYERWMESLLTAPASAAAARHMLNSGRFHVTSTIAHCFGLKGTNSTVAAGITAGLHALVYGYEVLCQDHTQDAIVVVAADEVGPLFFRFLDQLGLLASEGKAHGEALCPYDPDGAGTIVGEGAVALVLERAASARNRRTRVQAHIRGCQITSDAAGYERFDPRGQWLRHAIEAAFAEAKLHARDVSVIYGHGRGRAAEDQREIDAFSNLMQDRAVPVCCVTGNTGLAEASSGLFSIAAAAIGMRNGEAYPILSGGNLPDDLHFVHQHVRYGDYPNALIAGSTEYGNNAAVILGRGDF